RKLRRVVDDVDLLLAELAHHGAHSTAHLTDAGAFRVDTGLLRAHGDLRAVPRLAGEGYDLDDPLGELGNLPFEQLAHETRVSARHDHLRTLQPLRHARHVHADPRAVRVLLTGDLLLGGQDRLELAQVDVHHAGVGPLLDDTRDDLPLLVLEGSQDGVVAEI